MSKQLGSIPFSLPDSKLGFPLTMGAKKETIFRNYQLGEVTDQGPNGTCVDYCLRSLLAAEPISQNPCKPLEIYKAARKLGKTPDDVEGSQLNYAVDYLISKNIVKKDYWTNDADQVALYLNTISPIVMTIPWYERMNKTEKDGRILCNGNPIGFHAILGFRYDGLKDRIWLRNSWGKDFGINGNGYVTMKDLAKLMNKGGLACALVE
jgi:hypothetical protein